MKETAQPLPDISQWDAQDGKEHLRHLFHAHRSHYHPHQPGQHSATCQALTAHALEAVGSARNVAAYVSVGAEPCTRLLLDALYERGIRVLLPVLGPHLGRNWAEFRGSADLQIRAPRRPPEPGGEILPAEAINTVEVLLIPALAVDRQGTRLGQGGGWYDRVIPLKNSGATVFALLHPDELTADSLPSEPHDRPVDAIITHEEWFLLAGSSFAKQ